MKTNCLTNSRPRTFILVWLTFHLVLVGATLLRGSFSINTDLFNILPPSHSMQTVAEADKIVAARNSRNIVVLAGHEDFSTARNAIQRLYQTFLGNEAFESISLYFDDSIVHQITDYLFTYRYSLLDTGTITLLEEGGAAEVAGNALSVVFSPFVITGLDRLEQDPFMLTERRFQSFLSSSLTGSTAMSPKENILAAQWEGKWFVMLQGSLTKEATAITQRGGVIPAMKEFARQQEEQFPGLDFVFSGVPFHSFESSSTAQREISIISTVSLVIVLLLLLLVFRSVLPVVVSMANIGLSSVMAVAAVLLFLGEMNIMSLVFGTTLIGLGVDYSIHFFMALRNGLAQDGRRALAATFKGISFGFLSTQVCFILLFLAPFPVLKQIAIFLSFGLTSTYLSVVCLYPFLPPIPAKATPSVSAPRLLVTLQSVRVRKSVLAGLFIISLVVIGIHWRELRVENNLSQLYTMSEELAHDETVSAQVLDHGSTGWYYIVMGDTMDQLLQQEEKLRQQLDREIEAGTLSSYLATSLFVPSRSRQTRSYQAAQQLIQLVPSHMELLGFNQQQTERLVADLRQSPAPIQLDRDLPPYIQDALKSLWLGQLGDKWYSVVMPLHTTQEDVFRNIADNNPNVFFANLTKDVGTELNSLTRLMLCLMVVAIILILLLLKKWYSLGDILRIACIPVFILLTTMATLALCDIPLGFFAVAALLLVFGTGIDYIIYTLESEREHTESSVSLAIFLSYGTTAMSFGALVLTSFIPVHIFGVTVLAGLSAGYICSQLLKRQPAAS